MSESAGSFKESTLTEREHLDPDKHWIGDALPAAGSTEAKTSGTVTSIGTSPFPARADHTHDVKPIWAAYNAGDLSFTHGQERYFNNLVYMSGTNILNAGSTQLLIFPSAGLWQISTHWQLYNPTPGPGGWCQFFYAFNNATYKPTIYIGPCHNASGIAYFYMTSIFHATYASVDATCNLQISAYNASGGTANINMGWLQVTRISSL